VRFLPLLFLTGCATWSDRDVAVSVVIIADAITTSRIQDKPNVWESGPVAKRFLGPQPETSDVVVYFGAILVGNYFISRALPERWRLRWQLWEISAHGVGVYRNCQRGLC
jgi:hypothetical protein